MTLTCPAGHDSTATDYCDTCGLLMGADAARPLSYSPNHPSPCSVCGENYLVDDRYCEACGAEVRVLPVTAAPERWEALVNCDRAFFEMMDAGDIQFPSDPLERLVLLDSSKATIGRSSTKGERPDIDLSTPPGDPGVSHQHAVLIRGPDGTWSITDCGSANGTYLNDNPQSLRTGNAVDLGASDRIHVGAWTTIILRLTR